VPDPTPLSPGLGRRIDLLAVSKPRANQRTIWLTGLLAVWASIGVVSSAAAQSWGVAAIEAFTVVLAGSMWWVSRRAKRRAPATRKWIYDQIY
jgi:hypothetical protein